LIDRTVKTGSYITSFWEQMAASLVVGLTVATILTLVVTPCALALSDDMRSLPTKVGRLLMKPVLVINSFRKAN
jgi:multidrug efflux pump